MAKYTKEQIDKANKASIVEYATWRGIELRKSGNNYYNGVLHDSLVITVSKNAWTWNSRGLNGTGAVSFCESYELADKKMSDKAKFMEAVKLVLKSKAEAEKPHEEKAEPFDPKDIEIAENFAQSKDYLANIRKINPQLIDRLHNLGLIKQTPIRYDDKPDAVFIWRENGKIVGASEQGLTKIPGKRSYKKIIRNSTSGSGWQFDLTKTNELPHSIIFFESEIDAMSYATAFEKMNKAAIDTRFVAMDGLKDDVIVKQSAILAKELEQKGESIKHVIIACDNDEAGMNFAKKMHKVFSKIEFAIPNKRFGKDWNDVAVSLAQN